MSQNITFYNHAHNGDIFASKGYVKDLINYLSNNNIYYYHMNSLKLLKDLKLINFSLEEKKLDRYNQISIDSNNIFINTWVGNYLNLGRGINWGTYHEMFKVIYKEVSKFIGQDIDLKEINYYFPEIDFTYFNLPEISIPKNSIIISNGPVFSGQSNLSDLNVVIDNVIKFTDRTVILTHPTNINNERIIYTKDLLKINDNDLNEISWIAEQCDIIIGRNSGPFCFMHTKNILNDSNKTIISIGNLKEDSFIYEVPTMANSLFIYDDDVLSIGSIVRDI